MQQLPGQFLCRGSIALWLPTSASLGFSCDGLKTTVFSRQVVKFAIDAQALVSFLIRIGWIFFRVSRPIELKIAN